MHDYKLPLFALHILLQGLLYEDWLKLTSMNIPLENTRQIKLMDFKFVLRAHITLKFKTVRWKRCIFEVNHNWLQSIFIPTEPLSLPTFIKFSFEGTSNPFFLFVPFSSHLLTKWLSRKKRRISECKLCSLTWDILSVKKWLKLRVNRLFTTKAQLKVVTVMSTFSCKFAGFLFLCCVVGMRK